MKEREVFNLPNLAFLAGMENVGYLHQPLPNRRDQEIREFVDSLTTPRSYVKLRRRVSWDQSKTLTTFAERAASLALRQRDERLLVSGLVALHLAGFDEDEEADLRETREAALIVPLLLRSARRMGIKTRRLIRDVEAIVGKERALALRRFRSWSRWRSSLAAAGFRELAEAEDGLLYERLAR